MVQLIVVCGNNKALKNQLDHLNQINLKTFGFVEDIHELFKVATIMITKPGGITLSEALCVQLPVVLFKPMPGQEKENALFFKERGAAMIVQNRDELINQVMQLVTNDTSIADMKQRMSRLYHKAATQKIVEDILRSTVGL